MPYVPDEDPHTHYHGSYSVVEVVRILAITGITLLVIFLVWRFLQIQGLV